MKREITRTKGARFCTLDIELSDEGRLSISGSEGRIVKRASAKKQALEYWRSFFEDSPGEMMAMNQRQGTRFTSATGAAKYVLRTDGDLHGMDVHAERGSSVYVLESCGQIQEELSAFFPEVIPLLPYHLNDMHAGCEHQEALGWGRGKTIALTRDTLTTAQRDAIESRAMADCERSREAEYAKRWNAIHSNRNAAIAWIKGHTGQETCAMDDLQLIMSTESVYIYNAARRRTFKRWMHEDVDRDIRPAVFDHEVYTDSLGAPCPECGYRYGTQWLKRDLPPEIIARVQDIIEGREPPFDGEVTS